MNIQQLLKYYRLFDDVKHPRYATEDSACFDLYTYFKPNDKIVIYSAWQEDNPKGKRDVNSNGVFELESGERALIPTGIIFDIPQWYSVRLFARSSVALKRGLMLVNSVGVIDSDYVEPVFAAVVNVAKEMRMINPHERICQAELIENCHGDLYEIDERPNQKTDRDGGFGSTGVS
tara:strand:- start:161 stop:688 length:528 start_codon:yes stop_codon:yes gene_type:complete